MESGPLGTVAQFDSRLRALVSCGEGRSSTSSPTQQFRQLPAFVFVQEHSQTFRQKGQTRIAGATVGATDSGIGVILRVFRGWPSALQAGG